MNERRTYRHSLSPWRRSEAGIRSMRSPMITQYFRHRGASGSSRRRMVDQLAEEGIPLNRERVRTYAPRGGSGERAKTSHHRSMVPISARSLLGRCQHSYFGESDLAWSLCRNCDVRQHSCLGSRTHQVIHSQPNTVTPVRGQRCQAPELPNKRHPPRHPPQGCSSRGTPLIGTLP